VREKKKKALHYQGEPQGRKKRRGYKGGKASIKKGKPGLVRGEKGPTGDADVDSKEKTEIGPGW